MKRIKVVLALASMVVLLVAFAAPAMAKDNTHNAGNDRHLDQRDIRLDRQLLNDNNDLGFVNFEEPFLSGAPFFVNFENSCPFAGDTEGIVNEFDCLS
jgi:hypothetical protein